MKGLEVEGKQEEATRRLMTTKEEHKCLKCLLFNSQEGLRSKQISTLSSNIENINMYNTEYILLD